MTLESQEDRRLKSFDFDAARPVSGGQGYSVFVRVTKLLLPVIALGLLALVSIRLGSAPEHSALPEKKTATKAEAGQIELEGARYDGLDRTGKAYFVAAEVAARDPATPDVVLLTKPSAGLTLEDGGNVTLAGAKGTYDNGRQFLTLEDDITLTHKNGYAFTLKNLAVDIAARTAESTGAVSGGGAGATLAAEGLSVTEAGNLVTFKGPVHIVIDKMPESGTAQETPVAETQVTEIPATETPVQAPTPAPASEGQQP